MKLGRKNLLYSMAIAAMMLLLLVGYFIYMLPSLYVDYVMEQNLKSVREQHIAYRETGSYEGVKVRNSTACFSVEIPMEKLTEKPGPGEEPDYKLDAEMEELGEILQETLGENSALPLEIRLLYSESREKEFRNQSVKVHSYSDHLIITELSVEDSTNRYTNYIAMEQTDDRLIISVLPVVTPEADEIRPVVLQSLPMLGAVIILLVLLFSQMYSKGIVRPITALAEHAGEMKAGGNADIKRFARSRPDNKGRNHAFHFGTASQDEVRELADTLDDFYARIRESYRRLEEKNAELEEENRRQEVFLRASSHQLKPPIAAALLLVEGMKNKVGR